ncbi:MAG TPA: hypothetical protein VGX76_09275 [Pirellulales bacterium]|nr:hypothetical protein [Pirellulales bacterium]
MTKASQRLGALRRGLACLVAACAAGCGTSQAGSERYVPSEPTARRALDAALTAWKAGEPAGPIRLADPPLNLEVDDANRRPNQRLVDFEILGEVAAEGPRSFAVRLLLDSPREELQVRYYLVGIDPLWVMRQEDYDLVVHWDHAMPAEAPADPSDGRQP